MHFKWTQYCSFELSKQVRIQLVISIVRCVNISNEFWVNNCWLIILCMEENYVASVSCYNQQFQLVRFDCEFRVKKFIVVGSEFWQTFDHFVFEETITTLKLLDLFRGNLLTLRWLFNQKLIDDVNGMWTITHQSFHFVRCVYTFKFSEKNPSMN